MIKVEHEWDCHIKTILCFGQTMSEDHMCNPINTDVLAGVDKEKEKFYNFSQTMYKAPHGKN